MQLTRMSTCSLALAAAAGLLLLGPGASGMGDGQRPAASPAVARGGAWMGVWLDDAVDGGVEIVAVVPGGPAERARLQPGDIILRANRREIPVQTALRGVMERLKPGDPLELQLLRAGRPVAATLRLVARAVESPPAAPAPPGPPEVPAAPGFMKAPSAALPQWSVTSGAAQLQRLGLQLADVTPALRTFYGAPEDAGVLVTRAESRKAAGRAGIRVGDILVQLGDRRLGTEDQAEVLLNRWSRDPLQPLAAVVVRDRETRTVTLVSREDAGAEVAASEQRKRDHELLARRLQEELDRLQRRIDEIRRELEALREQR